MCRCSALFVVSVLVLIIAALACALGFVAPFWVVYKDGVHQVIQWFANAGTTPWTAGLWATCYSDKKCYWYFENDFKEEKSLPEWHKAAQGLYGVGLLLILIGVLLGVIQMCCCCCCKESSSVVSALGSLCISGAVLITAALGVWGGYLSQQRDYDYMNFYWAFFVAIGGAAVTVVAAILFFCEGCRARTYTGYHMTRVV